MNISFEQHLISETLAQGLYVIRRVRITATTTTATISNVTFLRSRGYKREKASPRLPRVSPGFIMQTGKEIYSARKRTQDKRAARAPRPGY